MTKKQYLQPEMMVSEILPNTTMLTVSPTGEIGIGGGGDPGGAF